MRLRHAGREVRRWAGRGSDGGGPGGSGSASQAPIRSTPAAHSTRGAAVTHVPGLFRTEDYARALFAYVNPEFPDSEVDLRVAHRMKREVVIEGAKNPGSPTRHTEP